MVPTWNAPNDPSVRVKWSISLVPEEATEEATSRDEPKTLLMVAEDERR